MVMMYGTYSVIFVGIGVLYMYVIIYIAVVRILGEKWYKLKKILLLCKYFYITTHVRHRVSIPLPAYISVFSFLRAV